MLIDSEGKLFKKTHFISLTYSKLHLEFSRTIANHFSRSQISFPSMIIWTWIVMISCLFDIRVCMDIYIPLFFAVTNETAKSFIEIKRTTSTCIAYAYLYCIKTFTLRMDMISIKLVIFVFQVFVCVRACMLKCWITGRIICKQCAQHTVRIHLHKYTHTAHIKRAHSTAHIRPMKIHGWILNTEWCISLFRSLALHSPAFHCSHNFSSNKSQH